jgi:hypothetical protein
VAGQLDDAIIFALVAFSPPALAKCPDQATLTAATIGDS